MQYDAMDDLHDFHAQMEVYEEAPMEVHITQPQMDQQQPHPPHEPQMVVLGPSFNDFKPHAVGCSHNKRSHLWQGLSPFQGLNCTCGLLVLVIIHF
jgi:hypothetical protein